MKKALEIVALGALVLMFAGLAWSFAQLPPEIPNHVNTGTHRMPVIGKGILLVFPIWGLFLYVMLSAASLMKPPSPSAASPMVLTTVKAVTISVTSIVYLLWIRQALAA